jgi:tRNA(adenine34) deaminase
MACIHARLEGIVYGAKEPKWGAAGSLMDFSALPGLNHRLRLEGGVMAEECAQLMIDFFKDKRGQLPLNGA